LLASEDELSAPLVHVNGSVWFNDQKIHVDGMLNFVSVNGAWTDSSLHATALGFVSVVGQLSAASPGLHEVHADTGSFILIESGHFYMMNYPFGEPLTDTTINNVRVWVG
jgi:hypothetical protein